MWNSLIQPILQIKEAAGIEIMLVQDGTSIINLVIITLQNNQVVKKAEWINLKSIHELSQKIPKNMPLSLTITGKNVLIKSMPAEKEIINYVAEIFPQINPNEFYYKILKQEINVLVAIARREIIDKIIKELLDHGHKILDLSLGFFDISIVLQYLNQGVPSVIDLPGYAINYDQQYNIVSFENITVNSLDIFSQPEYLIANQYLKAPSLISLSAASRFIAGSIKDNPDISVKAIEEIRNDYKFFKYFKFCSWVLLIGIFSLLLLNFIVYNHYFTKNKEMVAQQTISQDQLLNLKSQEKKTAREQNFLNATGWIKPSKTSYFADRLASLVPANLYLTSMEIYPTSNINLFDQRQLPYKIDTILIAGNCSVPISLNQFANNIKNIAEVKEVSVKSYLYKKENDNAGFVIQVVTK